MVEFALAIPIFLVLFIGIFEIGRLVFTYNAVYSASREAARYAAATDKGTSGIPRYLDCSAIRAAAKNAGILANLTDADIVITYDGGPHNMTSIGTCGAVSETAIILGDRIKVTVNATFRPAVSLGFLHDIPIVATTYRTLIKGLDVNVDGTF